MKIETLHKTNHPVLSTGYPSYHRKQHTPAKNRSLMINQIATHAFQQLPYAAGYAIVGCFFVATPLDGATFIAMIAISVVVSSTFSCVSQFFMEEAASAKTEQDPFAYYLERGSQVAEAGKCLSVGVVDLSIRITWFHELGHALTSYFLYLHANPTITLIPLKGGVTHYYPSELSSLGKMLGGRWANIAVTGAGTGFAMLLASVDLIAAYRFRTSDPKLSRQLQCQTILNIAQHAFYALSTFWTDPQRGHDFANLWLGGIHPLVSLAVLVTVPLIITLALHIHESRKLQLSLPSEIIV